MNSTTSFVAICITVLSSATMLVQPAAGGIYSFFSVAPDGLRVNNQRFWATEPDFQYDDVDSIGPLGDGEAHQLGGMFANVRPDIAYIAITNGSGVSLTPPSSGTPPSSSDGHWSTSMDMSGTMGIRYNHLLGEELPPGFPLVRSHLITQFSISGYLAPGAQLYFSFASTVGYNNSDVAQLNDKRWISESGEFSYTYYATMPFQHWYDGDVFDLRFGATLSLSAPAGGEKSWAVLDPGAGIAGDADIALPWAEPTSETVPEPSSLILFGLGAVGLMLGYRRSERLRRR